MKTKKPTIGMEIHAELKTNSKMFCGCPADHFGKPPNSQTCPVCLGLPGALPVPNKRAVDWTIMIGLALNCRVNKSSKFDRKHYFYPDLPKGYQISQYDEPLCVNGQAFLDNGACVRVRRVHIEEDTGKLLHKELDGKKVTLIDFNRSGVALVEIVTEPDLSSGAEAKEFAQKVAGILKYLNVSDCDMEKGSMRLEANVSWGLALGYKVEVKNLNSFRFVQKAIEYELSRQKELLDRGQIPLQETRGYLESEGKTRTQRFKEEASDYRYFPEPDIPPMEFSETYIKFIKNQIPDLPEDYYRKFTKIFKVRRDFAEFLSGERKLAEFAQKVFVLGKKSGLSADLLASYLVNRKVDPSTNPRSLVSRIKKGVKSDVVDTKHYEKWIEEAVRMFPKAANDYKAGKLEAISALIGGVMKFSKGKADPVKARELLVERLKHSRLIIARGRLS